MFDVRSHLDELRGHDIAWIRARREHAVREQRRWRVIELACTAVLDERGRVEDLAARDGVSERVARATVETARRLENLPAIAAAAARGELSAEQLGAVVELADESTDAEWARRAPHVPPADLARLARAKSKPMTEDSWARREAREFGVFWRRGAGMLSVRAELPDLDGAEFETIMNHAIDQIRPAKGQPWDTRSHRGADALMTIVRAYRADGEPSGRMPIKLVVQVPLEGPAAPACRSTTWCRGAGVAATSSPTSPRFASAARPTTTPSSCPTAPGSWPATPTTPTVSDSSRANDGPRENPAPGHMRRDRRAPTQQERGRASAVRCRAA